MYKVLLDGTLMCDSRVEELALIDPVVTLEENKAGSFSFTIPPKHPHYDAIKKRKTIIDVERDGELLFSGMCIEVSEDFYKQRKVYCEGELSYLNDSIQRPARYQGATVRGLLEAYIANHNSQVEKSKQFTVGMVTVTDDNDSLYCYTNMESTMKCLKNDLVDDLGGFFRTRHKDGVKYIDYLAEAPNTNSQIIKLGRNLVDYKSNIDSTDIATEIIPLGAKLEESAVEGLETRLTIESVNGGLDYVSDANAISNYGHIAKTVTWDDVTTPDALLAKARKYLAEIQFENVVIEAKAVDLHLVDKSIEQFKLSDQIRVVSEPHGMNRYFRLTKLKINLNNPEKDTITLGKTEKQTLSAKSNKESAEIKKAIEKIKPNEIMKQAVENASELIANAMGGYVVKTENELLVMDTNDIATATKVWRWNVNGLGYSSNGYNGEYALAMTMDGAIVADRITTGILNSIKINNGDGKFTVDENGKVKAVSGTIAGWNISTTDIYKAVDLYDDLTEAGLAGVADDAPVQYIVWLRTPSSATTNAFYIGYRPKSYYLSGGRNWYNLFTAKPNGEVTANKFKSSNAEITGGRIKIGGISENSDPIIELAGSVSRKMTLNPYDIMFMSEELGTYAMVSDGAIDCGELISANPLSYSPKASMLSNGMITSVYAYNTVVSNSPNVVLDGATFKRSSSSSERYKTDITEAISEELNPQKLYDVPVKMFKYKEGYLSEGDSKIGKDIIGFIVEDLEEKYQSAVQYNASGEAEMWNSNIMIPAMLKLIQEQNSRISQLEERLGITNG